MTNPIERSTERAMTEQELRMKLNLLVRTGTILMESNADCNRIMRNLKRCMAFLGLPEEYVHIHLDYNIIMINISDDFTCKAIFCSNSSIRHFIIF